EPPKFMANSCATPCKVNGSKGSAPTLYTYRSGLTVVAAGATASVIRTVFQIVADASMVGATEYNSTVAEAVASLLSCCIGVGVVLVPPVFATVCFLNVNSTSVAAVAAPEISIRTILIVFVAEPRTTIQSWGVAYGAVAEMA